MPAGGRTETSGDRRGRCSTARTPRPDPVRDRNTDEDQEEEENDQPRTIGDEPEESGDVEIGTTRPLHPHEENSDDYRESPKEY